MRAKGFIPGAHLLPQSVVDTHAMIGVAVWRGGLVSFLQSAKAVVTDAHFLIPVAVLLVGIVLLVELH